MSFADANRASIRVIEEATWGTTPVSGKTREVRLTSSSLSASKETVVSDELRADRMISSITEVSAASSGDVNFEYSAGAHDEFLAAFLMGAWSRPMDVDFWKGASISITGASAITVTGSDITGYLTDGYRIKLAGFVDPANNGYFSIASSAPSGADTVITIVESTLVAETGTVNSRLYDANDVIVLNDTNISASAAGFDSNATNAFAAAIAAGQLVTGQKIYVDGLGVETGTITASVAAIAAVTITISDGVNSYAFVGGVDFTIGVTFTDDAAALADAINANRYDPIHPVNVKATAAAGVVTVTNLNQTGGSIVETVDDINVVVVDFSGGVAGTAGLFTISSATDDLLVVSPAPTVDAAGAAVTVKGSLLRNPGDETAINQRMFSIETAYADISQYMLQDGMVPGTFSLEVAAGSIITGTIGFQGRATALSQTTTLSGGGYTVLGAQTGEVVNATTDVGNLTKDNVDFSACLQTISLSGEANLRQQACVGSKFSQGIGAGRFNLTGSMTVFFEDEQLFNDFIDHETVALSFSVTDAEGSAYYWTVPAVKISQDQIAPGGIDQDVFENIEFTAFRDSSTECMVQIDRFSPNAAV